MGAALLKHSLMLGKRMAESVGVVVDAKPEAVAFYSRYGFEAAITVVGGLGDRPQPTTMFLPLNLVPD